MWKYSDVRLLDLVDAVDPNQDLIALYTRINNNNFQIRIDFLDLVSSLDQDVYIPIDTNPGGTNQIVTQNNGTIQADINWDYLIIYPKDGKFQIVNSNYFRLDDIEIFILINSNQDNIILSINQKSLPTITPFTKIQVITTPPYKSYITDQIGPTSIDGPSPSRAKVLFVFWDTFYSSTSAEALRSWAGAHSGPISSRHGLKYLLDFADKTYNPIFLLDLMTPDTSSALDYLNADNWIEKLIKQGKIITYHNNFGLDNYWKLYINYKIKLNDIGNDYAHSYTNYETCFQFSEIPSDSISFSGLFNECKSRLISNGFNKFPDPVVLGGDFQSSMLGDPAALSNINSYIFNHPWIQVLKQQDIQTSMGKFVSSMLPGNSDNVINMSSSQSVLEDKYSFRQVNQDIYSALITAPENQLSDLAWKIFEKLSYPTASELIPLGNSYIGQIGLILTAARWVNQPEAISSCKSDLDFDGELECVLASNNIFIIIEPKGSYVPFIFSRDEQGAHQIVGPTWEFMLGISDPSTWDLSLGIRSDSAQILGAFVDDFNKWDNSEIITLNNSITFTNSSMSLYKSFILTENGVLVKFSDKKMPNNGTQIPLVLDPWTRYSEDWGDKYKYQATANGIEWKIDSGKVIEVQSNNLLTIIPFNMTHDALARPEDPNFDYGRGHYLPFPIALIEFLPAESYQIDIVINP
jgi:hypothetical protein